MACFWGAVFSVKRWIEHLSTNPYGDDFRVYYYAARLGLQQGWGAIYDQAVLRGVMAQHFTGDYAIVDGGHTFPNPPSLAWLIAPLTVLPWEAAYIAWAVIGVACLVAAWWLAAPRRDFAGVTLLLLAVALWPIHYSLIFGQPTGEILLLVAAAWWFLRRDRPLEAGIALALATSLKPQDVALVPIALLVSGRLRVFGWWAAACAALGVVFFAALGTRGVADFWSTNVDVQNFAGHQIATLASLVGPGLPALAFEGAAAAVALVAAWRRRVSLELVFAAGLAGSVASALHAHESDFSMLVLAGWFVLQSPAGLMTRLWMVPGIAALQAMSLGFAVPVLIWEVVWVVLLAMDPGYFSARQRMETPNGRLVRATSADSRPKTAASDAFIGPGAGTLKSD